MSGLLLYGMVVTFLSGIAIASLVDVGVWVVAFLIVVAVGLCAVAKRGWMSSLRHRYLLPLLLFAFVLGLLRFHQTANNFGHSTLAPSVGSEVSLTGVVVKEPERKANSLNLTLDTGSDIVLVQGDRFLEVGYGDKVSVTGTLKAPQSFVTDFGREFNYPGYLKARGVEYYVSYADVEVVEQGLGNPFLSWLLFQKQRLMFGIETSLSEPQAGLGEGLLLGVKQALGSDLEEAFRVSGIVHIVVLSGYNIMLIMTFILFIGSYVMSRRPRLLVALGAVTCFALLVGLSATVVRASIMVSLLIVAQLLGRSYHVMRALCFAAAVMVAINPYLLVYDIGFQLSFMATLGLLVILPSLELYTGKTLSSFGIREFLLSTIATQIAVLPLLMYHVGQVSLVAVVVNVLVLPMVPLAMLATFGAGLLALLLPAVAIPFAFIAYLALSYIITIATTFAALPFAAVVMPPLYPWWIPVLYGAIGILWYRLVYLQKEHSIVDDWEVVEEETLAKKAGEAQSASPADNLPVFFR